MNSIRPARGWQEKYHGVNLPLQPPQVRGEGWPESEVRSDAVSGVSTPAQRGLAVPASVTKPIRFSPAFWTTPMTSATRPYGTPLSARS